MAARAATTFMLGGVLAAGAFAETTLSIWGAQVDPDSSLAGTLAVAQAFEKRNPGVRVRTLGMGAGSMNSQKLLTGIVGGSPPDLVYQARFNISDWASRGAFLPLDDYLKQPGAPKRSDYYEAPWNECLYEGRTFGIPTNADDRVLYWNRGLFRKERKALEAAGLDWQRPPRTWSETLAYSRALTKKDVRAGFLPNFGNAWLFLYASQNGAKFLSEDGKTCTLGSPEAAGALAFMKEAYDIIGGYGKAAAFQAGFQGGANDPFIQGQVAMKIDGDWALPGLARYGPGLDFGVAPAPIPDDRYLAKGRFKGEKDKFITWIGGFSYAMPRGCPNPELAWKYIQFATSLEGRLIENKAQASADRAKGRTYLPRIQALKSANDELYRLFKPADPKFADGLSVHMKMMDHAIARPPTIVGQLLWDEHVRATEQSMLGKQTPEEALSNGQKTVQRELDRIDARNHKPVVSLNVANWIFGFVLLAVGGIWAYLWRRSRLGKMAAHEALWGLACISPWLIGFLVLTLWPMLASLFLSLTDYDGLSPPRWTGLSNYSDLVGPDKGVLLKAFGNAIYLAGFGVPLSLATGLAIALLLNAGGRGISFFRTAFYLPAIVPVASSSVLWAWLLTPDAGSGLINAGWAATIGTWMQVPPPGWLTAEDWAKPALILMGVWGAGSGMILWLAGLKGIPKSLYEAAELDGAGSINAFRNVTLPMLSPVLFFNLIMGLIGAMQEFDRVYIMGGDGSNGPSDSLLVPVKLLFTSAFGYFRMGYASALAWAIFALLLILTLVQLRLGSLWVHEEADK